LFLGIHADLRSGPLKELAMEVKGAFQSMNPREWRRRNQMTVEVGMGRGDRDEVRAGLIMLGGVQRELKAGGSPMVSDANLYATIERVAETFGITDLTPFMTNPAMIPPTPPQAPPPDPSMEAIRVQDAKYQADAQRDAAKLAADEREKVRAHERFMAELALKQSKDDRDEAKAASDIQDQEDRLQLDRDKAANDDDFKRDKLEVDAVTGYMRDAAQSVTSDPAVSYDDLRDGR
jgi:type IV secretory pathway VirB10-like protein